MSLPEPNARHVASGSKRRQGPARGISVTTQSRIDAGLMSARLPWPVAIYLVCVLLPLWFHLGPLFLSALRVFLLIMIVPLFLRLLSGAYGRIVVTDVLFVLHVTWTVVALTVNNPAQVIAQTGSVGVEFLGGYMVGRAYVRTPETFLALCRWLVAAVICLAPLAVLETLTYRVPVIETIRSLPFFTSVELIRYEQRLGLYRAQVVFAHPIHFGLFCSVVFALAFTALKGVVSDTRRWISALLIAATGFLSLSSGAFLAILLQVALIAWAAVFTRIRWRWWLLTGLFALAYVVIDILSDRTPIRIFMTYATFSAHTAFFRAAIFDWGMLSVWSSPIVGIGLNDWVRPSWMFTASVDNFWLLIAMRYGIPGFLLLTIGYVWAMVRIMRRNFDVDSVLAQIRRAWVFIFMGLSFTLCTVHVWGSIYSFTFFLFGAGIWLMSAVPTSKVTTMSPPEGDLPRTGHRYSRFALRPRLAAA
jgi:hypothetical protein